MFRVLHLRDTTRLCGPGKTILETVRRSPDRDIEYEVATFGTVVSNSYLRMARDHCPAWGMPESRVRLPYNAIRLARHVREHEIAIVHSHDFKTRALAALARPLTRATFLTTAHGHVTTNLKSRLRNKADNLLLRRIETVFAVSEAMKAELQASGVRETSIEVVRNCIVLDDYPFGHRSSGLRTRLGLAKAATILGYIGRLSAEKGQIDFLEAFGRILREEPDARLVFVGEGPDEARLRAETTRRGLDRTVRFLGHTENVIEVLGGLDLLVLSSRSEGLPNVVLEAMATGVPVVAKAVGGVSELVHDGVTGILVRPDRPDAMVQGVLSALRSPTESVARARAARELVEREFGMDRLIRRTHDIYRTVLRHSPRGAQPE